MFVYIIGTIIFSIFIYYKYLNTVKFRNIDILAATSIIILPFINYFIDVFNLYLYILLFTSTTIIMFILYTKIFKIKNIVLLISFTLLRYSLYGSLFASIIYKVLFKEKLRYIYEVIILSSGNLSMDFLIVLTSIVIFIYMDYRFVRDRVNHNYIYLNRGYKYSFYTLISYCVDNIIIAIFFRVFLFYDYTWKYILIMMLYLIISELIIKNALIRAELVYTKHNLEVIENQLKFQVKHYQNYEIYIKRIRSIIHDIKGHKMIIDQLSKEKKHIEVENFINEIKEDIESCNYNSSCENVVIDAIIKNKYEICKNNDIYFTYDLSISQDININGVDLSIIFNNIIDNAIEACENIKLKEIKKYISIDCKTIENKLVCIIENSRDNKKIKIDNNFKIKTRKKDKINHGFGLENFKSTIEKYDGITYFKIEENLFQIKFVIPL